MTKLTTHVLDVYSGKPGRGISVDLYYLNNSERKKITSIKLNDDGRASSPLAEGDIFVKGNHSDNIKQRIISNLIQYLNKIQVKQNKNTENYNFIIDKLNSRELEILEISNTFLLKKDVINLISKQKKFFQKKKFHYSVMHGDYCFSNILYDMRNHTIKLIDPRGFLNRERGFSFYGPYIYDYFKLAHSYIGKYDFIISGE